MTFTRALMATLFSPTKRIMQEGDLAIIWINRSTLQPITLDSSKTYNSRYGDFPHSSIIGKPFGSKMKDPHGKGYIYLLRPTPELWTLALPHRTQIVYTPDTAFILAKLDVRPGTICIEAGTGSGSFTHALARQVSPGGKVLTFEFHEKRHDLNIAEFAYHGLNDLVVAQHRDVCADGFDGPPSEAADCAFLDLPAPWDAIHHLPSVLTRKRVSRVCCFSPCIEQVLNTHTALRKNGFTNVSTYDLYYRNYEARPIVLKSVDEACERLLTIRNRVKEGLPREPKSDTRKRKPEDGDGLNWKVVARGDGEIQTHTSFLTFGELMPLIDGMEPAGVAPQEETPSAVAQQNSS